MKLKVFCAYYKIIGVKVMVVSKEEMEILRKFRDARITKDVLIVFTQIVNDIIKKRPLTKNQTEKNK